ncbi:MAG: Flp pilus assembly protein CpaB [Pseudomonadota bacterium]
MMRIVFALILFMGIAIAGGAVYMAMERFNQYEAALAHSRSKSGPQIKLAKVYVAKSPLEYGQQLTRDDVTLVDWPAAHLPEGVFKEEEALLGSGEDGDVRTVVREMVPGEVVLATKLTGRGEDAGVSSRLERGMRAFAIRVDVASGVSGFLRPGDRVDVYWTGRNGGEVVTKLILDDLELIAIDQSADSARNRPTVARTVTVSADSRTIAALVQAQSTGSLLLSLRGIGDDSNDAGIEVTHRDLLGIEEEEEVVVKEKQVCTIKNRRGSEVIEIPIPCAN